MIGKVIITSTNPPCRACGGMDGYHYTSCSLIAAAPDLLEACKLCLVTLGGPLDSDFPLNLQRGPAEDAARAAIAKAEGRPADAPTAP